ncbi:TrmH family RNA methyltransferase [Berryella wangjianweii]|uniref:TrmH family RNA methyltransferase n=1 Tax=Berryella wangjianweii TaxID=2734634 RepID=UPI001557E635|nr:RNA methyltransferase [Berryella wangjianweii]
MPIVRMTHLDYEDLRLYSGLTDGQLRRGEGPAGVSARGVFIAESQRVIERALDAGVRPLSLFVEEHWFAHERAVIERVQCEYPQATVYVASNGQFRGITGYEVTRGALAAFERPQPLSLDAVLARARRIAILEDVTNYANMGALFRSASALGVDAVLTSPSCHDPLYRRCARVSMGTVFQVPWVRLQGAREWAPAVVPLLRRRGFVTAAMALRPDAVSLRHPALREADRLALVLGTEGEGLFDSTIKACDHAVMIPMSHGTDSLNVASAAAIAFWELCHSSGEEGPFA